MERSGGSGRVLLVAAALALAQADAARGQPSWELEARFGDAWNAALPVVLRQEDHGDLRLTPRWRTEALKPPVYYAWRVARWHGDVGWALDFVHHKLHLHDPPPEVGSFSISHGYNLATLQRLAERRGWRYGGAVGVVLAHPESKVRGRGLEEDRGLFGMGYYLTGPCVGALLGRSGPPRGGFRVTGEARVTLARARVPIAGGSARVPNLALHATVGLGWSWPR